VEAEISEHQHSPLLMVKYDRHSTVQVQKVLQESNKCYGPSRPRLVIFNFSGGSNINMNWIPLVPHVVAENWWTIIFSVLILQS